MDKLKVKNKIQKINLLKLDITKYINLLLFN